MATIKEYDLEKRTAIFSLSVRDFCMLLKKDIINIEYIKQLVRSASSVGANYIEANDNLGPYDLNNENKNLQKGEQRICLLVKACFRL